LIQLQLTKHLSLQGSVIKTLLIKLLKKISQRLRMKSNLEITNPDLRLWPTEVLKFSHLEDTQRQSLPHGLEELLIWLMMMVKLLILQEICQTTQINLDLLGLRPEPNQDKLLLNNMLLRCNLTEMSPLPNLNMLSRLSIRSSITRKLEMLA